MLWLYCPCQKFITSFKNQKSKKNLQSFIVFYYHAKKDSTQYLKDFDKVMKLCQFCFDFWFLKLIICVFNFRIDVLDGKIVTYSI